MNLIDTNIFLEVLLEQRHAAACRHRLERALIGEEQAIVTDFSIYSVLVNLEKRKGVGMCKLFLAYLKYVEGLRLVNASLEDHAQAVAYALKHKMSFDDALQYAMAKKHGARAIVSMDKVFDRLDIPRLKP